MSDKNSRFICMAGEIVPYKNATIGIGAVALKYGAQIFEGIRCYKMRNGAYNVLAMEQHIQRLFDSARIMRMPIPFTAEEIKAQIIATLKANNLTADSYIRLACSVGEDGPITSTGDILVSIAAFAQGRKTFPEGQKVCINGWQRISDAQMPPRIKCVANYQNGRLAMLQAKEDGYDNVLLTDSRGKVCEAPTATFFLIRGGKLITPAVTDGILESITRDIVIRLAQRLGYTVIERSIDRTELYLAEGLFFAGTGAEILPVGSVDGFTIATLTNEIYHQIHQGYFTVSCAEDAGFTDYYHLTSL
ncbi:aminotransferase class IV [Erwinia sp. BC051422]|uniref:aminotransferase class IV n=1 Tax=Erwinia wuhanensis TaxID=3045167 RepID=UPI002650F4E9|nr:aminotransferase class IV [Erwinia sp. BC051422]MDN8541822.1 aminotransferase class IV [Erwinia sp. BC051422]